MNIELIDEMENAGFTREQTIVLGKVIESDIATKQDIKEIDFKIESIRAELKRDIESIRAELNAKIESTKNELKRDIAELNSTLTFRIVCVVGIAVGLLGTMMTSFKLLL